MKCSECENDAPSECSFKCGKDFCSPICFAKHVCPLIGPKRKELDDPFELLGKRIAKLEMDRLGGVANVRITLPNASTVDIAHIDDVTFQGFRILLVNAVNGDIPFLSTICDTSKTYALLCHETDFSLGTVLIYDMKRMRRGQQPYTPVIRLTFHGIRKLSAYVRVVKYYTERCPKKTTWNLPLLAIIAGEDDLFDQLLALSPDVIEDEMKEQDWLSAIIRNGTVATFKRYNGIAKAVAAYGPTFRVDGMGMFQHMMFARSNELLENNLFGIDWSQFDQYAFMSYLEDVLIHNVDNYAVLNSVIQIMNAKMKPLTKLHEVPYKIRFYAQAQFWERPDIVDDLLNILFSTRSHVSEIDILDAEVKKPEHPVWPPGGYLKTALLDIK